MEKPDAATIAWYERAVPPDARAVRSQMFGFPCAFVNGNMFFGTFADSVVARVGPARAHQCLEAGEGSLFEPMPGRAWREYIQVRTGSLSDERLAVLADEALQFAAGLPPKAAKTSAKVAGKRAAKA